MKTQPHAKVGCLGKLSMMFLAISALLGLAGLLVHLLLPVALIFFLAGIAFAIPAVCLWVLRLK